MAEYPPTRFRGLNHEQLQCAAHNERPSKHSKENNGARKA